MNDVAEMTVESADITDILGDVELSSGDIDKIQRLKNTGWSNDFKSRLCQFILGATALWTANYWGVQLAPEAWVGEEDKPVEEQAEVMKREDSAAFSAPPNIPGVDLSHLPADIKEKYGVNDEND